MLNENESNLLLNVSTAKKKTDLLRTNDPLHCTQCSWPHVGLFALHPIRNHLFWSEWRIKTIRAVRGSAAVESLQLTASLNASQGFPCSFKSLIPDKI